MHFKRITILAGHYGSGKTNVAVNLAFTLKKTYENVVIADADIVNPYFRTKDSESELEKAGIRLICSKYANSNVDIPAMPQELYAVTDDKTIRAVMDIGGDDRGAYALGRFSHMIAEEDDYEMLAVVNMYRPLSKTPELAADILKEIEAAAKLKFTGIVNNSNLGKDTRAEDIFKSLSYAEDISKIMGIPVKMTCVKKDLYDSVKEKIKNVYPLTLQKNILS